MKISPSYLPSFSLLSSRSKHWPISFIQSGFDSDAVPSNYIDAPPANVSTVRRNLVLLRKVLKTTKGNNDIYQVRIFFFSFFFYFQFLLPPPLCSFVLIETLQQKLQKLISDICATTYQTIDLFLQDMRICISEYANIPVQQAISMTPAQLIEELNKRSNIGSDVCFSFLFLQSTLSQVTKWMDLTNVDTKWTDRSGKRHPIFDRYEENGRRSEICQ